MASRKRKRAENADGVVCTATSGNMAIKPLFSLDDWIDRDNSISGGLPCTNNSQYCFLCYSYNISTLCDGNEIHEENPATQLANIAKQLYDDGAECRVIAQTIHAIYHTQIKQHMKWVNPLTAREVNMPDWKIKSVIDHLNYSRQFPRIFNDYTRLAFQHFITDIVNTSVVNGEVDPEKRTDFLEVSAKFSDWKYKTIRTDNLQRDEIRKQTTQFAIKEK